MHYDTKEGLAGSTVYSMCQDKEGFMWFATENGLSRYDGTHFKNFTVKDGLPDNEVLKVFADGKGRVWIATFSKELCFYYQGKIHNKENDSLIRKIDLDGSLYTIGEDNNGFIAMATARSSLKIITPGDSIINYSFDKLFTKENIYGARITVETGKFYLLSENFGVFKFDEKNYNWIFLPVGPINKYKNKNIKIRPDSFFAGIEYDKFVIKKGFYFHGAHISNSSKNGFLQYLGTTDGAWSIDTVALIPDKHYLPGEKISCVVEDKEKNLWFSSLGDGVYKLLSHSIKSFVFSLDSKTNSNEVFSIVEFNKGVLAGRDASEAEFINSDFAIKHINYNLNEQYSGTSTGSNRLYSMIKISKSLTILGFDKFLVKLENDKSFFNYVFPVKSIDKIDDNNILVGTSFYTFKMRLSDLQITDTIWRERCTKVFYLNHKYYIGTLKGLYEVNENKTYNYLGNLHHALTRRITDIKATDDNTLWISTSDNGIVALKNNTIINAINDSTGLSSNICKTLFIKDKTLWVGTDKGINKINLQDGKYQITKYSTSDGLPSNTINALYIRDSIVWVGSPAGLTYFNENSISDFSMCNLKLLGITVSGKEYKMDTTIHLSYNNNNIHFEYAGISFRSGGEIMYHYKLTGLDNDWKTTTQNNLDYKSLPAGDYKLELYAVNKYGVKSNTLLIDFSIAAPFWKTGWFYIVIAVLTISGISWMFNKRNKKTRQRLEEKNNYQKQLALLEQQALQSQMNPHFIFNCLNSIQQYILTNEKEKANQYLTGFAALIRQTLDISSQKSITVSEEASYLKKYLNMERMRFGDTFNYSITINNNVKADYIHMPALLLQPYVENSLRHGIRYKTDGAGKVIIDFCVKENRLHCTIKDNGIGRDKAAAFKSKQHIEYQSKGMSLTSKRIELLNSVNENKIVATVTDLLNDDNTAAGTVVEINIPI
ncbi:histidine kinase [Ferruginibacter profundus]